MANIPLQHEPITLDQMWLPRHLRDRIKYWIAQTPDPEELNDLPNLLFVTGDTGTGKGTIVRNLIRATHCFNRKAGSGNPCGECEACRTDPRDENILGNVVWVACGSREGESDYQKVKSAIQSSAKGPHQSGEPHRDILFVVFDEVHLLPANDQSALLTISEHNAPDVKYICITAEPEEMKPKVKKMLQDRGGKLVLPTPTPEDIKAYLQHYIGGVPEESLALIAGNVDGSYREAISDLFFVGQYDPNYRPDSVATFLQTVTWQDRKAFWECLTKRKAKRNAIRQAIDRLKQKADDWTIAQSLLDDLYFSEEADDDDSANAIRLLTEWCRKPYQFDLKYVLVQLKGLNCVDLFQNGASEHDEKRAEVTKAYAPD